MYFGTNSSPKAIVPLAIMETRAREAQYVIMANNNNKYHNNILL